jgi:hydrogenase 3 maturation protease
VSNNNFEDELRDFIRGANKIAILGIGNDLRSDDGLGIHIIEKLSIDDPRVMIENVGSVPEGFARNLAEFGAERVIMVDAADMMKPPDWLPRTALVESPSVHIACHFHFL